MQGKVTENADVRVLLEEFKTENLIALRNGGEWFSVGEITVFDIKCKQMWDIMACSTVFLL